MADSVIGLCGKDFVLIGADSAQSRSIMVIKESGEDKIMELDPSKLLACCKYFFLLVGLLYCFFVVDRNTQTLADTKFSSTRIMALLFLVSTIESRRKWRSCRIYWYANCVHEFK
jgi:hypothetical protein